MEQAPRKARFDHRLAQETWRVQRSQSIFLHSGLAGQTATATDVILQRVLCEVRDDRGARRLETGLHCRTTKNSLYQTMKKISKSELAKAAGVSERTLRRWLAEPYMRRRLRPFHLKKQQIYLPPEVVKIICDHYVIEIN